MRYFLVGSMVLLLVSCGGRAKNVAENDSTGRSIALREAYTDTAWFADFRELSTALSRGDRNTVKGWFKFPIMDTLNEIWSFTDTGELSHFGQGAVPFTEKDFDERYDRLFPPEFIKGLAKLKLDSLVPGMADDLELGGNDSLRYSLISYVDGAKTEFNILLNSTFIPVVEGKRDEDEAMESSVGFIFDIREGRKLVFREVRLAD